MLSILTLAEAIDFLTKRTGHAWSESELFDTVAALKVRLYAPVPETVATTVQVLEPGKGLVEKFRLGPGHSLLAVLFPIHVARLLISGETTTVHPHDSYRIKDEYKFLTEPIRVTRSDVRILAETMELILQVWVAAQNGVIPDSLDCPAWMLDANAKQSPAVAPVLQPTTRHKLRTNSVDVPIKKAIEQAGTLNTGAVYLKLKSLALDAEPPFTGIIEGDALCYTNDKNKPDKLTKDALGKRLKNHVLPAAKRH